MALCIFFIMSIEIVKTWQIGLWRHLLLMRKNEGIEKGQNAKSTQVEGESWETLNDNCKVKQHYSVKKQNKSTVNNVVSYFNSCIYIFSLIQIGTRETSSQSKKRKINNRHPQLVRKDGSGGFPCESCARDRSTRAQSESPLAAWLGWEPTPKTMWLGVFSKAVAF